MFVVYRAINLLLGIMEYAILARVILSWIPISRDNQFIRLIYQVTEPILAPIRALIERSSRGKTMMIDFSPIIAWLIISFIRGIVRNLLNANMFP